MQQSKKICAHWDIAKVEVDYWCLACGKGMKERDVKTRQDLIQWIRSKRKAAVEKADLEVSKIVKAKCRHVILKREENGNRTCQHCGIIFKKEPFLKAEPFYYGKK